MGAVLQLERFDHEAPAAPDFRQAELDAAFAEGLAEGLCRAEAQRVDRLCEVLAGLSASLESGRVLRAQSQAEQVRALAPLLDALFEQLLPAVARIRLRDAVLAQLAELAGAVSPLAVRVRCDPRMGAFLSANLARLGLSAMQVDDSGPDGSIEAEMMGGEILWDEAALVAQLRRLIEEMMEAD